MCYQHLIWLSWQLCWGSELNWCYRVKYTHKKTQRFSYLRNFMAQRAQNVNVVFHNRGIKAACLFLTKVCWWIINLQTLKRFISILIPMLQPHVTVSVAAYLTSRLLSRRPWLDPVQLSNQDDAISSDKLSAWRGFDLPPCLQICLYLISVKLLYR